MGEIEVATCQYGASRAHSRQGIKSWTAKMELTLEKFDLGDFLVK